MSTEKEFFAICGRQNEKPGENYPTPITKGIEAFCNKCDHKVWISDSTIASIKQQNPELNLEETTPGVLCVECGMKELEGMKEPKVIALTELQKKELLDHLTDEDDE